MEICYDVPHTVTLSIITSFNDTIDVNSNKYQSQRNNKWANTLSKGSNVQNQKEHHLKKIVEEIYFSALVCYFQNCFQSRMFSSTCIIYPQHLHSWEGALVLLMAASQIQNQPTSLGTAVPYITHHCYPEAARMERWISICYTIAIVKTDHSLDVSNRRSVFWLIVLKATKMTTRMMRAGEKTGTPFCVWKKQGKSPNPKYYNVYFGFKLGFCLLDFFFFFLRFYSQIVILPSESLAQANTKRKHFFKKTT